MPRPQSQQRLSERSRLRGTALCRACVAAAALSRYMHTLLPRKARRALYVPRYVARYGVVVATARMPKCRHALQRMAMIMLLRYAQRTKARVYAAYARHVASVCHFFVQVFCFSPR